MILTYQVVALLYDYRSLPLGTFSWDIHTSAYDEYLFNPGKSNVHCIIA